MIHGAIVTFLNIKFLVEIINSKFFLLWPTPCLTLQLWLKLSFIKFERLCRLSYILLRIQEHLGNWNLENCNVYVQWLYLCWNDAKCLIFWLQRPSTQLNVWNFVGVQQNFIDLSYPVYQLRSRPGSCWIVFGTHLTITCFLFQFWSQSRLLHLVHVKPISYFPTIRHFFGTSKIDLKNWKC